MAPYGTGRVIMNGVWGSGKSNRYLLLIKDYNGGDGFQRGESNSGTVVAQGPWWSDTLNRGAVKRGIGGTQEGCLSGIS